MHLRHSLVMMLSIAMLACVGLQSNTVYADSFWNTDSDDSDSSHSEWGTPSTKPKQSKISAWQDDPPKKEDEAQNAKIEGSAWGTDSKKTTTSTAITSDQERVTEPTVQPVPVVQPDPVVQPNPVVLPEVLAQSESSGSEVSSTGVSDDVAGVDLRVGLSVPVGVTHLSVGVQGHIEIGYRWQYFGLYLQQSLGGNFYLKDDFHQEIKEGASAFSGSTYLTAKGLISSKAHKHYFAIIFGLGVTYGNFEYMPFMFPKNVSYPYPGLTLKAGLGYEYRINRDMTWGVSVEYTPYMVGGMKKGDYTFDFYHMTQPYIHFGYTF